MMASKMLRRSGVAVGIVAEYLEWKADIIYQVGVGNQHEEMTVLMEEWGPELKIIGCEPHPEIDLSEGSSYPGFVHQVAVSNYCGDTILHSKRRHKGGSSLHPHIRKRSDDNYKEIRVPVTTLDLLFPTPEAGRLLLWLDCEGSELAVMQGGTNFLKRVDVVNIELTAKAPGVGWATPVQMHNHLVERGFWLQYLHTQRMGNGQNDGIYVRPELFKSGYCCLPHEIIRWEEAIDKGSCQAACGGEE